MKAKKEFKTSERHRQYMAKKRKDPAYRERQKAYMKAWRTDPIKAARKKKKDNERYKRLAREIVLAKHGVTVEEYDRMLANQGGTCGICGGPPRGRWNRYAVDHDHQTGKSRGLLCDLCNRGLGFFQDKIENLQKAERYLLTYYTKEIP